ncbi:NUDIX hydrolase [Brucella haematophila]|uniref:NUDIX hydrolase n=1 Tax=Brucella haematophila TaxID=419474 RepID=UPI00110D6A9E|nr:NUDIX hydrolase [Brucella haematophila]TMV03853.1 NUDIX hydrolase [Brucella haematophila]
MTATVSTPLAEQKKKVLRPRDAASLLLIDRSAGTPRVLMGKRHHSLAFMPGKFVFPGGRADSIDGAIAAANELSHDDTLKLLDGMGSRPSMRRARALGLCAIRETFEETGLRVAYPVADDSSAEPPHGLPANHQDWRAFLGQGALPALSSLRYFARAVTPPEHVRRFDTRFFIAFCDSLPEFGKQQLAPSGELENLDWVSIDDVTKLDVALITQIILKEAKNLLAETRLDLPAALPVVQYRMRHGRFVREVI